MTNQRALTVSLCVLAIAVSQMLFAIGTRAAVPQGTRATHARVPAASLDPLTVFATDSGLISTSIDAIGSDSATGAPIRVHKNAAGATLRHAWIFGATVPGNLAANGDVSINGTPINWDSTGASSIGSTNAETDITALIKPAVDAAPAGDLSFNAVEKIPSAYDGEEIVAILSDPTVSVNGSVTIMYGAQQTTGDTFNVGLAQPFDSSTQQLTMSLGISFGYQQSGYETGQVSQVDVNGNRMSSAAGGPDDCATKYDAIPNFDSCGNGSLITAGGIGDSPNNPQDPNATDFPCALGQTGTPTPGARCDDELYNLNPFVASGATNLTVHTLNPSNDDNIFTAVLMFKGTAAVVGQGVTLGPTSATNNVGQPHTLTAHVQDSNGAAVSGVVVTFTCQTGPNAGLTGTATTAASGDATFTYTSAAPGTDTWVATFHDSTGAPRTSNQAQKTWVMVAVIPEARAALMLPLGGLLVGGVWLVYRRRTSTSIEP